jgi:cytochrome c peroxidase
VIASRSFVQLAVAAGLTLFPARAPAQEPFRWELPKGFPPPLVPADNPMTAVKVELGRYLFYDTRLSVNGKTSCATCHRQELAFTDGRLTALGTTGQAHTRNAMSLVNVAYNASLTWSDPHVRRLEDQAPIPIFGVQPIEMGLREADGVPASLAADARYRDLFARAFPGEVPPLTMRNAVKAIAAFERTIISAASPYDRYHYGGDNDAVSAAARRGETLFYSQPLSCFRCHGGFNFSDAIEFEGRPRRQSPMHATGVASAGMFKAPSLRNVVLTAPYMHDGSLPSLEAILDRYAAGGGHVADQDPLVGGFPLSAAQRSDIIEFLRSLTDDSVLHNPRFANPW